MVVAIIIISFVLDSVVSNFISLNSLFAPLLTLVSLIIVYPYFNGDKFKYFGTCFVTGIAYDLIYTDTIIIHGIMFVLMGFIVTRLNLILANNYLNVVIMAIILIICYRFLTYGLLLITNNISFSFFSLFKSIYSSILGNAIYVMLSYIVTDKISRKFKIRKAN